MTINWPLVLVALASILGFVLVLLFYYFPQISASYFVAKRSRANGIHFWGWLVATFISDWSILLFMLSFLPDADEEAQRQRELTAIQTAIKNLASTPSFQCQSPQGKDPSKETAGDWPTL